MMDGTMEGSNAQSADGLLEVSRVGGGFHTGALPKKSRASVVRASVHTRLLSGEWHPGDRLKVVDLSKEYGVSTAAVREALAMLSATGLVKYEANRGFVVWPFVADDVRDLTFLRIEIETLALRRSIARGGIEWEGAVAGAYHRLRRSPAPHRRGGVISLEARADWNAQHKRFHAACAAACGSPRLLDLRASLFAASEVFRQYAGSGAGGRARDVSREHQEIMEATLGRDEQEASSALRRHLESTMKIVLAVSDATASGRGCG